MAQRSKQRPPVYSADTLALRYLAGLILVALGIMIFLAVGLRMQGNVFEVLRQTAWGLTGGLAVILPLLPVWAGVLVIWSSQRKAPVRPFLYGALAFVGLCAFIVLATRIGSEEFLDALKKGSDGSWGGVIQLGFFRSQQLKASGGALGIGLAYPLWTLTGTLLGGALVLLATLFCLLMAVNLTPGRIRDLVTGRASLRIGSRGGNQAEGDSRQIAFQQEQERQRQAYAQQQAYMMQQQAQARAAVQGPEAWGGAPAPDPAAREEGRGWTGRNPAQGNQDVREWQQQLTEHTAAVRSGGKSSIFGRTEGAEKASGYGRTPDRGGRSSIFDRNEKQSARAAAGVAENPGRKSSIFGRRKEEADGLSDLSEAQKRQEGMAYPASTRLKIAAGGVSSGTARMRKQQEQVEEDLEAWRRPREETAEQTPEAADPAWRKKTPAPAAPESREETSSEAAETAWRKKTLAPETPESREEKPAEATEPAWRKKTPAPETPETRTEKAARETEPARPARKTGRGASWMDQVMEKESESLGAGRTSGAAAAPAPERKPAERAEESRAPEQIRIPAGKPTIPDPTWQPELKRVEPKAEPEEEYWEPTPYYAPPITDLKKPEASTLDTSREDEERSRRLEETLSNFRVQARVVHVTHGPAISRFELELAPGTKVGKISELEKDIAYGMQATSVRIEAPIPGKSLVGVEVPNPKRATVTLREVLESAPMQNAKSILTVALGKDIAGTPIVCDLARMPHLLIAGATGSGKSVCINTIINSLLYRASPDEVRLILVDPKVVELQCYNRIPHLLLPVVNDPHKAAAALAWAVAEMMERYDRFSERGVRNLEGYNAILGPGEKPMPRIVIIIDELADLMMVCKKDVEEYICRLTQLARAAGIHLIVATQRPSVDVITGLIKANIPSRIAFKTASYVDSRTILDRNGSEQLLGWGDMLYLPTGSFAPTRIQGCFLSDEEVNRIADHVRQANPSQYDPNVLDKLEQLEKGAEETPSMDMVGGPADNAAADADLFAQAVEFAIADGQISTSTLQRRLKVGYARAGRLTDEMEERGIVSAKDGSKPRKCLITREEWEAIRSSAQ